jgi:hypothetical protein
MVHCEGAERPWERASYMGAMRVDGQAKVPAVVARARIELLRAPASSASK